MSCILKYYLEYMDKYARPTCTKQTEPLKSNPKDNDSNINQYKLIDSLKNSFHMNSNEEIEIKSFIYQKNDFNNTFIDLLVHISTEIHKIDSTIKLSLNLVHDYSKLLEISVKLDKFDDLAKVEKIDDELSEIYSYELLDNIVFYVEF